MPNPRFRSGPGEAFRTVAGLFLLGSLACDPTGRAARADSTLLAEREARFEERLARAGASPGRLTKVARWELPLALREISGLTLTADGRLLAHDDNLGRIFEVDYRRGVIVKEFGIGEALVQGDFEAITTALGQIYLLTSDGILHRFEEGDDGAHVDYEAIDTGLGKRCEFEAIAFEPGTGSLLLACKAVHEKSLEGNLVIYRWGLPRGEPFGIITVPAQQIIGSRRWNQVRPTDMAVDPATGHYVILLREGALVELTPGGGLVAVRELPDPFEQPEGIALTPEGLVLISDEAGQRPAAITLYKGPFRGGAQ